MLLCFMDFDPLRYNQCTEEAVDDANTIHTFILAQTKE